jgi:PHD/YefM family antitoxin component YafN of YafNO toxin-antitoxin module
MSIPKIKSASELRQDLYTSLKEASDGIHQVVTHKQGEPVVLISQSEYNRIFEENALLRNLAQGLTDVRNGNVHTTSSVKKLLNARRKNR